MSLIHQSPNILRYIASFLPLNSAYKLALGNQKLLETIWHSQAFWKFIFLKDFGPLFPPTDDNWFHAYRQAQNQIEIVGRYIGYEVHSSPFILAKHIKMIAFGKNHLALVTYSGDLFMAGNSEKPPSGANSDLKFIRNKVKFVDCAPSYTAIIDEMDDLYIMGSGRVLGLGEGIKQVSTFKFLAHQVGSIKVRDIGFVYIKADHTAYFCRGTKGAEIWTPKYLTRNVKSVPWLDSDKVYVQTQTSNLYWLALDQPKIRHRIMTNVKSCSATMYDLLVVTMDHKLVSIHAKLVIDTLFLDHKITGWGYQVHKIDNVKFVTCNTNYQAYIDFNNNLFVRRVKDTRAPRIILTESDKFELFETNVTSVQFYMMGISCDGFCLTRLVNYAEF